MLIAQRISAPRGSGRAGLTALLLLLLAADGCGSRGRKGWELGFGSFATDLSVARVVPRGDYLDVSLVGHGLSLDAYTPRSEACNQVLLPEAQVDYVERGVAGRLRRGDVSCDAVGIGGSRVQRARQPRRSDLRSTPIPRAQATFREVHRDEEVILVRGRFPLASQVGWSGGGDSVAVLPNDPVCQGALAGGVASMEYRPAGRTTLSLVGAQALCPIIGLILPLDPAAGTPESLDDE